MLSGSSVPLTVTGLQGNPVSNTAPTTNYVLTWNGSAWAPAAGAVSAITQLTGDVLAGPGSGSVAATVVALQGHAVSNTVPTTNYVLAWNGSAWISTNPYTLEGVTGTGFWFSSSGTLNAAGVTITGDVSQGALSSNNLPLMVTALQGHAVSNTAPTTNYVLTWSGSAWAPATTATTGITQLTGDVTAGPGTGSQAAVVVALQGHAVANTAPTTNYVLTWGGSSWGPAVLPATTVTGTGFYWSSSSSLFANAVTVTGDVSQGAESGNNVPLTVTGLQTYAVSNSAPSSAEILVYHSSAWTPTAVSGDSTLSSTGVVEVTGLLSNALPSLTAGYLQWTGSAWVFNASSASVTGTGLWYSVSGSLHSAATTLTGDVSQGALSGSNVPLTVTALQGHAVSSSAPSDANLLIFNSGTPSWAPVAMSGDVTITDTGVTKIGSISFHGTAGQFLVTNSGATASTWVSLSGDVADVSGTPGKTYVTAISGSSGTAGTINIGDGTNNLAFQQPTSLQATPPTLLIGAANGYEFPAGGATPGVGAAFTLQAGNGATYTGVGNGANGGNLVLNSGYGGAGGYGGGNVGGVGGNVVIGLGYGGPGGGSSGANGQFQLQLQSSINVLNVDYGVTTASTFTYTLGDGINSTTFAGAAFIGSGVRSPGLTFTTPAGASGTGAGGGNILFNTGASGGGSLGAGTFTVEIGGTSYLAISGTGAVTLASCSTGHNGVVFSSSVGLLSNSVGTAGQFLLTNTAATVAAAWTSLSQDVSASATTAGAVEVTGLLTHALPSLTSGYLEWTGSAWAFGAGGTTSVTGTGLWYSASGSLNAAAITLGTDVSQGALSGSSIPITVTSIHGSTVPAGGSLTTGNVLQVSGASALSYAAVNLAGGSNYVTGNLPVANLAHGTAAQVLVTNSGATAPAWVAISGDATISAAGAIDNTGLLTHALPSLTSGYLEWTGSAWAFGTGGSTSVTGTGLWYSASGSLNAAAVTLTGDVSEGALSGSNVPLTVTGLKGAALPTLAQGVLYYTGSAWALGTIAPASYITAGSNYQVLTTTSGGATAWGAVNLAQSAAVTGNLPITNVAPGSNYQVHVTTSGGASAWGAVNLAQSAAVTGNLPITNIAPSATDYQVLTTNGSGATAWGAVNLAQSAAVTGLLPVGNLAFGTAAQLLVTNSGATAAAWVSLSSDVTISAAGAATVGAIHGSTVPAGGSLTTGNTLYVSGASALSYGALNLAGGANYVTGNLPVTNIAPSANTGDVLTTTSGGSTTAWSAPYLGVTAALVMNIVPQ